VKVTWVSQDNPTSAADALDKSIAKWRFFSYCTAEQFHQEYSKLDRMCGLCYWDDTQGGACENCLFGCPPIFNEATDLGDEYEYGYEDDKPTLAEFHTAARKVFAKLRSLKKH
jgi:hypothetical protein